MLTENKNYLIKILKKRDYDVVGIDKKIVNKMTNIKKTLKICSKHFDYSDIYYCLKFLNMEPRIKNINIDKICKIIKKENVKITIKFN